MFHTSLYNNLLMNPTSNKVKFPHKQIHHNGCICLWGNFTSWAKPRRSLDKHCCNDLRVPLFVRCSKVISRVINKYIQFLEKEAKYKTKSSLTLNILMTWFIPSTIFDADDVDVNSSAVNVYPYPSNRTRVYTSPLIRCLRFKISVFFTCGKQ